MIGGFLRLIGGMIGVILILGLIVVVLLLKLIF